MKGGRCLHLAVVAVVVWRGTVRIATITGIRKETCPFFRQTSLDHARNTYRILSMFPGTTLKERWRIFPFCPEEEFPPSPLRPPTAQKGPHFINIRRPAVKSEKGRRLHHKDDDIRDSNSMRMCGRLGYARGATILISQLPCPFSRNDRDKSCQPRSLHDKWRRVEELI